jgi:serine/threonine-protein kinase SRPK3
MSLKDSSNNSSDNSSNNSSNDSPDNSSNNSSNDSDSTVESEFLSTSSDEVSDQDDNLELKGDILNNYNIIYELGRGSYSIVWLAYNITNNNFYALKVQNPKEYKDGFSEIKFVEKLPKNPKLFNNIVEHFTINKKNNKFLCSVWELHYGSIDSIMRKGKYEDGLPLDMIKKIMKQLLDSINILHRRFKVYHADIKTDNILLRGLNERDEYVIQQYLKESFFDKYTVAKNKFWINKGKNISKINDMKKEDKLNIRKQVHKEIVDKILKEMETKSLNKYGVNQKYINDLSISLADFGMHCEEHNFYESQFGTRYYQAPEIILMGECSFPVDIWAIGCTFYELLTGRILFDPTRDSKYSRNYYHLCLINNTCGDFPENFIKKTKYFNKYFTKDNKIIDFDKSSKNRLDTKLDEHIKLPSEDKKIIRELLIKMLTIDPNKRITIDQLVSHPFFNY